MDHVSEYRIPGLATVTLRRDYWEGPILEIRLDPAYQGDLNDIASTTPGAQDLYLRCDMYTAADSPELAKFLEVMDQWDYTGDGEPDCDGVIDAIRAALYMDSSTLRPFERPHGSIYVDALMRLMPPAPSRHITFSFGRLRPRYRWYHYASAIPAIAIVFGLIQLELRLLPWMGYSVVTGLAALTTGIGIPPAFGLVAVLLAVFLLVKLNVLRMRSSASSVSPYTYGVFNKAAVFEEQAFREGAEHWSVFQRARSCLIFGAVHMINLIYPLAAILPLALGGSLFMAAYLITYRRTKSRRAAVLESSLWHRVYNRIALITIVLVLIVSFGTIIYNIVGVVLLLALLTVAVPGRRAPRRSDQEAPVVTEPIARVHEAR